MSNCSVTVVGDLVTNLDMLVKLKEFGSDLNNPQGLLEIIKSKLNEDLDDENTIQLKRFCSTYCSNLHKKWLKSHKREDTFRTKHNDWLDETVSWPDFIRSALKTSSSYITEHEFSMASTSTQLISPQKRSIGTYTEVSPRKPFSELQAKQKKRRVENIENTMPFDELSYAFATKLRANGRKELADIIDYLIKNPHVEEKVKDCIRNKPKTPLFTEDEALGLCLSLQLSKWQYNSLRKSIEEKHVNVFPSYYNVQKAKLLCYPPADEVTVTDTTCKIKLQALLDLTTSRLLKSVTVDDNCREMKLISKWGFDGASDQSRYKQKIQSETDDIADDSSIFMGSLVPIKLQSGEKTIWENKSSNSSLWCRPIFFKFIKENLTTIQQEMTLIESEINALQDTRVNDFKISHSLLLTMIDGKVSSILSGTSTQRCDICKASPKEMNELEIISAKTIDTEFYKYGLSSLHMWIRMLECILHIAYRLDFKTWIVKGEDKIVMENRKKNIQDAFRAQMGLLVDVVKQGHGTTNDGNTARRFFADYKTSSSITGVDENLIRKFGIILQVLSSGNSINVEKFREYAKETLKLYIDLYKWYYMPSSVHKVLVHGADIIASFSLIPIGKLSEEASESRNKDFRRYRLNHSRKFNRTATNQDILNNLLVSSDPYISIKRIKIQRKKHKDLSEEAKTLLTLHEAIVDDMPVENFNFVNVDSYSNVEVGYSESESESEPE